MADVGLNGYEDLAEDRLEAETLIHDVAQQAQSKPNFAFENC